MGPRLALLLATGALALTAGPTLGHHSFAMFNRNNQIDLEGVVQEFRFANPHTFIYLAVKQDDPMRQRFVAREQLAAGSHKGECLPVVVADDEARRGF